MKYLFVCKSNRGRSQIAEGFFNHYYSSQHQACSAGTKTREQGYESQLVPYDIIDYMHEVGMDITEQWSKQLTPRLVELVDKVVVMCEKEWCPDFLLQSNKAEFWPIEDPYHKSEGEVRKIRDDIGERVRNIFNKKD